MYACTIIYVYMYITFVCVSVFFVCLCVCVCVCVCFFLSILDKPGFHTHIINPVVLLLKVGVNGLALFWGDSGELRTGTGKEVLVAAQKVSVQWQSHNQRWHKTGTYRHIRQSNQEACLAYLLPLLHRACLGLLRILFWPLFCSNGNV